MLRALLQRIFGQRVNRRRFLLGSATVAMLPAAGGALVSRKRSLSYLVNVSVGVCIINTYRDEEKIALDRGRFVAFDKTEVSPKMLENISRFVKAGLVEVVGIEREAAVLAYKYRRIDEILEAEWSDS